MAKVEYCCSIKDGEGQGAITIDRVLPDSKVPQGLAIYFCRAIRVPERGPIPFFNPNFGFYQLHKIHDYAAWLPQDVVDEGGIFFPMYQKEALCIRFKADAPFMIKIYCGDVNVVSGALSGDSDEAREHRMQLARQGESIQDYVVVPGQGWVGGVTVEPSVIRQFVAMPTGDGFSVEAHLTGKEVAGRLRFEVTPARHVPVDKHNVGRSIEFDVVRSNGESIHMKCSSNATVSSVQDELFEKFGGLPQQCQRLLFEGTRLGMGTLADYNVETGSVLDLHAQQGGSMDRQRICQDKYNPEKWIRGLTLSIPVHILNSQTFRKVTGLQPPASPIDARTYTNNCLQFLDIYKESAIDVSGTKPSGALCNKNKPDMASSREKPPETAIYPRVVKLSENRRGIIMWGDGSADDFEIRDPHGLLGPQRARCDRRASTGLEAEIRGSKQEHDGDYMVVE